VRGGGEVYGYNRRSEHCGAALVAALHAGRVRPDDIEEDGERFNARAMGGAAG